MKKWIVCTLLVATFLAAGFALPMGVDWEVTFYPAARAVWIGENPYIAARYMATPPWALVPALGLAWMPVWAGRGVWFGLGLVGFAWAGIRAGAGRWGLVWWLLSPPVVHCLLVGNVDWAPLVGLFVEPRWLGVMLLLVKPQMGLWVVLLWGWQALEAGGWRGLGRVWGPGALACAASFLVWGWPAQALGVLGNGDNASLWPWTLPVGVGLVAAAWRRGDGRLAMAAGPCLSQYALLHSWSAAVLAVVGDGWVMLGVCVGLWALVGMGL